MSRKLIIWSAFLAALAVLAFDAARVRADFSAVETEPNNTFATPNILPVGPGRVSGTSVAGDVDHFRFTGTVGARVLPLIHTGTYDTILGRFSDVGAIIESNDDSFGLLSALHSHIVGASGRVNLAVTGFADFGFSGAHGQTGSYTLELFQAGPVSAAADTGSNNTFATRQVLASGTNTVTGTMSGGDVDFFGFSGLTPGSRFAAEISAGSFDTILGAFNDTGVLITSNDDAGGSLLSIITGIVPASGNLALAVTGFADFGFSGGHGQSGSYTLTLFAELGPTGVVIPEPSSIVLLGLGAAGVLGYYRRRRQAVAA